MNAWKRLKRLWALFGTVEAVNEDGTTTRRTIVRRSSRVWRTVRPEPLWRTCSRQAYKSMVVSKVIVGLIVVVMVGYLLLNLAGLLWLG
jgi:hypothetical protein